MSFYTSSKWHATAEEWYKQIVWNVSLVTNINNNFKTLLDINLAKSLVQSVQASINELNDNSISKFQHDNAKYGA